jgi:hypothetical protein
LRRLEKYLAHIALHEFRALSPMVLSAFVTASSQELGKTSVGVLCSHLRMFVGYLYREGLIGRDLRLATVGGCGPSHPDGQTRLCHHVALGHVWSSSPRDRGLDP